MDSFSEQDLEVIREKVKGRLVYEEDDVRITEWNDLKPDHLAFISNVTWGSHGPRYRIPRIQPDYLLGPTKNLIRMEKAGRLIGSYLFVGKSTAVSGTPVYAWYRTLLAVEPEFRRHGLGQMLVQEMQRYVLRRATGPTVLFGYAQSHNQHSIKVLEDSGYENIGKLDVLAMTRMFPRPHADVGPVLESEKAQVIQLYKERYADHDLVDVETSFNCADHWVMREKGKVVAGASFSPFREQLLSLPNPVEQYALRRGGALPLLGRVLDFDDYQFLWFSTVYYRGNDSHLLFRLFSAIMHRLGVFHGMMYVDRRSPFARPLRDGDRGLVGALSAPYSADILVKCQDIDIALMKQKRPTWISPMVPF